MKNIWRDEFIIIYIILIVLLMIYSFLRFYRYKRKLKAGSIELIKLEKYKPFSYLNLIVAFLMLVIVYQSFFSKGIKEIMFQLFFILCFFASLLNTFTQPQNYLIISLQGFGKLYFRKLVPWAKVESIAIFQQKVFITADKKTSQLLFANQSDLNHLLVRIKNFRPDLYDKCLMNLNIA